jgi:hypothetical protein
MSLKEKLNAWLTVEGMSSEGAMTLKDLAETTDCQARSYVARNFFTRAEKQQVKYPPELWGFSIKEMIKKGHKEYLKRILPESYFEEEKIEQEKNAKKEKSSPVLKVPDRRWTLPFFIMITCIIAIEKKTGHILSRDEISASLKAAIDNFLNDLDSEPVYILLKDADNSIVSEKVYVSPESAIADVFQAAQKSLSIIYISLMPYFLKCIEVCCPNTGNDILSFAAESKFSGLENEGRQLTKLEGILIDTLRNDAIVADSVELEHSHGRLSSVKYAIKPEHYNNAKKFPGKTETTISEGKKVVRVTKLVEAKNI